MKNLKNLALTAISVLAFASCSKSDPAPPPAVNEEEFITTVTVTLSNSDQVVTLKSKDLDGDGPNSPVVTVSETLLPNTTYTGTVKFLNEISNPVGDLTLEVEEEGTDHQVFFQAPTTFGVFTYNDLDKNGKPIGLDFTFKTGTVVGKGTITVTLRHEPNKSASGVATGSITNAGGATDAEVTYPIEIKE
jgi:hypothetical protein